MAGERLGILLLPGFSLLALGGLTDALAEANRAAGAPVFHCLLLSEDGAPVASGSGISLPVAHGLGAAPGLDAVFVVADAPLPQRGFERALHWLQTRPPGTRIGALGSGAWLLARGGLLNGHRATIHWPYATLLAEEFPRVVVSSNLLEIDRDRLTCGGGTASIDLVLHWLTLGPLRPQVGTLVEQLGLERQRMPDEQQRVPLAARIGGGQPKLTEAVALMEANLAEPLPTEDIARLVGVSRRQLERLFKQHLDSLPARYYLELRLKHARKLLAETTHSILQIGLLCGFSSGPHFSSAYRAHFGITPREQRSPRLSRPDAPAHPETDAPC